MLVRTYVIPALAVGGAMFAAWTVHSQSVAVKPAAPVAQPATSPFQHPLAGSGLIEPSTELVSIGTRRSGVVSKRLVNVGDRVKAGDLLLELDSQSARAELAIREAALREAQATLERLRMEPRAEDVPPAQARVAEFKALLADANNQLAMVQSVVDKRAVSQEEIDRRRFAVASAEARLSQAEADLTKLMAGAWKPAIDQSLAAVETAKAQVELARTEVEWLSVCAPMDGEILQVNARLGEYAQAGPLTTPLMVMGDTRVLHVRVDIDENDAWRLRREGAAVGSLRGNRELKTPLTFVRIEPYVVPKRSLTGASAERVDTRVLQVLYAFDRGQLPAYVGQQMDVFIDAPAALTLKDSKTSGHGPQAAAVPAPTK